MKNTKLSHIFLVMIIAPTLIYIIASVVPSTNAYQGGSLQSGAVYNWEQSYVKILTKEKDIKLEKCESEKQGAALKLKANAFDPKNNPATVEQISSWVNKRDVVSCF